MVETIVILIIGRKVRTTKRRHLVVVLSVLMALGAACGDTDAAGGATTIVATTTVLGDVAGEIAGDDATVRVLIPVGADPHDYQPSSQDVAAIQRADLVVANGLGLEDGLVDVLDAAVADGARVLEIAPGVDPLPFGEHLDDDHDDDHGDEAALEEDAGGHDDGNEDPHVWLDPLRMADAAGLIAAELAAVDGSVDWGARAEAYAGELRAADAEIVEILRAVPDANRKLVTNHDALGYFADRYGFEVIGTVVPGGATLAEPSSAELAALVEEIEAEGVRAIFAETTEPSVLADAIAAETGGTVEVVELYTGSLGEPGSGADTLIGMLITNARRIAEALA
jgi:zinc/manganese transport system substrate-binding protein